MTASCLVLGVAAAAAAPPVDSYQLRSETAEAAAAAAKVSTIRGGVGKPLKEAVVHSTTRAAQKKNERMVELEIGDSGTRQQLKRQLRNQAIAPQNYGGQGRDHALRTAARKIANKQRRKLEDSGGPPDPNEAILTPDDTWSVGE
jgi:hypothetical protein